LLGGAGVINLKLKLSLLGTTVTTKKSAKRLKNTEGKKTTGKNF